MENQVGVKVKVLYTKRRGEFFSQEFKVFYEENDIHRKLTTPYILEKNGIAKWKNQTIIEIAKSMLKSKDLSNQYWAEAIHSVVYRLNISPINVIMGRTPCYILEG